MTTRCVLGRVAIFVGLFAAAAGARAETAKAPALPPAAKEPTPPKTAQDQLSTKFAINNDNPEASVPTEADKNDNPLEFGYFLQDLLVRAEAARKEKKYSSMVAYYRAVAKAAPERSTGWRKLCEAYRLINDWPRAARSCKNALEREGAQVDDFVQFVTLTLRKDGPLTDQERADVDGVLQHLAKESGDSVTLNQLRCQLGVKTNDVKLLETCSAALAKAKPDDAKTVIFQWTLAVRKGQGAEAARLLDRARELGLPEENLASMQKFTPAPRHWGLWAAVAVALALVAIAWTLRRRRFVTRVAA